MAEIVLRIRLVSGDQLDVRYEYDTVDENEVIQRVVETLAENSGVLRTRHGDRLMVVYGRALPPSRWPHAAQSSDLSRRYAFRSESTR
jgi:hypothetical protein